MDRQLFWDILDSPRTDILPLFAQFKASFYLADNTALALQLGHRDSIDFGFFSEDSFSTIELEKKVEQIFVGDQIIRTHETTNALSIVIDSSIKLSFFSYPYKLIRPPIEDNYFRMASIEDIGAMKLSAITGRSTLKDYVDLYFILQRIGLKQLLEEATTKFPTIDSSAMLKSLVYFADIKEEPILFKHGDNVSLDTIKEFLSETVKAYLTETSLR